MNTVLAVLAALLGIAWLPIVAYASVGVTVEWAQGIRARRDQLAVARAVGVLVEDQS